MRCLEKDPAKRWPSADALLAALEAFATGSGETRTRWATIALPRKTRSYVLLPVLGAVLVVLGFLGTTYRESLRRKAAAAWVKEEAIPRIQQLADSGKYDGAFRLAMMARERQPADSALATLWPRFSMPATIHSEPPGARVYLTEYGVPDTGWQYLGTTPLDSVSFPFRFSRIKLERDDFPTMHLAAVPWALPKLPFVLEDSAARSDGMVRVLGGETDVNLPGLDHLEPIKLGDYRIGRHEVTNREFKRFVDAGGYRKREFWEHKFVLAGKALSWEDAFARFRDKTGRLGPASWEGGDYPSQQGDYPVTGVSWYEAAAYSKYAGKQLPTVYHWSRAAFTMASASIVPLSNFTSRGPAPAGQHRGIGPYGTFDMAGNAREWCLNQSEGQRYILGGGWNDPAYAFNDAYAQSPFDRSATNGFRLAQYLDSTNLALAARRIDRLFRDYTKETPVPDHIFQVYRRMYDYDRTKLSPTVEAIDSSAEGWIHERVSFNAAYGGERVIAHLFLPKDKKPPYQTLVYFPGSDAIHERSSRQLSDTWLFDFILKSGRAVMFPVYKGTYERGDSLRSDYPEETNAYKEHVIMWGKDLRRSVDYLETRAETDTARLAYYGVSWGGMLGGLLPAIEPRLKASVLLVAGLQFQRPLPEADPLNYLPRIKIPVLMLNGQYDHYFPVETSQAPMFRLLGTPPAHKRQVISEGGHFVPRHQLVREVLDWLDRYLGPAQ